jgi:hypothetical protein
MPKKSEATGATFAGHEGIVEDANQRLWEVDPSRNADGTVVDGFESDERDISSPNDPNAPAAADDDLAVSESDDDGQEKSRSVKAEASDAENARSSEGASDNADKDEKNGVQRPTGSDKTKSEEESSAGDSSSKSSNSPASSTQKTMPAMK